MYALLPYLAGIGCSLCYGIATFVENFAARQQETIRSIHPSYFLKLLRSNRYIFGIALDLLGWLLFLFASRSLPLFLDLSFVASSLMVTALLAHRHTSRTNSNKEVRAIALVMIGIVLLGLIAQPSHVQKASKVFIRIIEIFPLALAALGALCLRSNLKRPAAYALAASGGLAFGATGIISRVINLSHFSVHTLTQLLVLALAAYGILGMIFMAAAFQRDTINRVNTAVYSSELIIPSLLGIAFLGDRARHGLWPLLIVGFIGVILGTLYIAKNDST